MQTIHGLYRQIGRITGGPFTEVAKRALPGDLTIKLASEVDALATINVSCKDFGVFDDDGAVEASLLAAAYTVAQGRDVYVGCMGGIGRTGTWMAIMAGLLQPGIKDTVKYVRKNYRQGAVERREQEAYVKQFLRTHRPLGRLCQSILEPLRTVAKVSKKVKKVDMRARSGEFRHGKDEKRVDEALARGRAAVQSIAQDQHKPRGALGG